MKRALFGAVLLGIAGVAQAAIDYDARADIRDLKRGVGRGQITALPADVVKTATIEARAVTAAKLPAVPSGQLLIGGADSNVAAKAVSGAVTINSNGVVALAARAVTAAALPEATSGKILIGGADSNLAAQAVSGVITLSLSGVTAFAAAGVTVTNVIVSGDSKTNTIVVTDGRITGWTVEQ